MKLYFIFLGILCLSIPSYGQIGTSTVEPVNNLSYDMLTKQYQKLPINIDLTELSVVEQLKTKTILYEESIHYYFQDDQFVKESRYHNQQNLYPSWYLLPDVVYYSSAGTEQIFASKSSLYPGGWWGHNKAMERRSIDQTELRLQFYENDWHGHPNTGRFITKFDQDELTEYSDQNTQYSTDGFLPYYIPTLINHSSGTDFTNLDFGELIHRDGPDFEQVYNNDISITWYASKGLEEILIYENGDLSKIISKEYLFDPVHEMYLLNRVIEIIRNELSTGECYEQVEERYYSNYEFNRTSLEPRSAQNNELEISISPNPTKDNLLIDFTALQLSNSYIEYHVIDNSGISILKNSEDNFSADKLMVNIAHIPSGMYHILIQVGNKFTTKSFVKY